MTRPKTVFIRTLILVSCLLIILTAGSTTGKVDNYEVQPQVKVHEYGYKSELTQVIESYEKLMGRYMDLSQTNLNNMKTNVIELKKTTNDIKNRLYDITTRLARIEKALDIEYSKQKSEEK